LKKNFHFLFLFKDEILVQKTSTSLHALITTARPQQRSNTTNYMITTWFLPLCHKMSHFLRPSPGAWRRLLYQNGRAKGNTVLSDNNFFYRTSWSRAVLATYMYVQIYILNWRNFHWASK